MQPVREASELIVEGARGRADAVQQDERRSRARLAVGENGAAALDPAGGPGTPRHAASKVTDSGAPEPTTMLNFASVTPSLRK